MKKQITLAIALLLFICFSCKKEYQIDRTDNTIQQSKSTYDENNSGHIKIAVLSDIHYMDPSLLQNNASSGTAFNNLFKSEPYKVLLEYSPAILNKVISELLFEKPDIVLVSGDMAKDGERICHEAVAGYFDQLRNNGIKVYVVPGNNDINNPASVAYNGNTSSPVPNVTPSQFTSIYWNYGFSTAIAYDPNSLSYVAEPFPGLRILAIDAARYTPIYHRSGRIKPETMLWIKQQMTIANENNITVLGLMHHNLIEHFSGQPQITPYTIVEDLSFSNTSDNMNWVPRADSLISWGLKVIFTGHSHASDISKRITNGNVFYDIVTGSPVTPPSPYRIMVLKNKELDISTNLVKSVNVTLPNNQSFIEYSNQFLSFSFDNYFNSLLKNSPYLLSGDVLTYTVPLARNAYMAHIAGEERIDSIEQMKIDALNLVIPRPDNVIFALNTLWTDLGIKDIKWHIKLTNP